MNYKLLFFLIFVLHSFTSLAQIRLTANAGFGPALSYNSQEIALKEEMNGREYAAKAIRKAPTYTAALNATYDIDANFFLSGELRYLYEKSEFQLAEIIPGGELGSQPMSLTTTEHKLGIPVSVGARYKNFKVLTGFDLNFIVDQKSDFESIASYSYTGSNVYTGWHGAIGAEFGRIELEVRYMHDFRNVGEGYTLGEQDLDFYGQQGRWLFSIGYRLF